MADVASSGQVSLMAKCSRPSQGGSTPHDGVRVVDTVCCLRVPARSLITSGEWVCCERLDAQVRRQSSGCADTHRLSCALIVMIC